METTSIQRRNRRTILLIALLFFLPFAAAWYFARHSQWVLDDLGNYGHLVTPVVPLDYRELLREPLTAGETLEQLQGRWILLTVAPGACTEECRQNLYKTRQIRLMLNKEIPRVRRLLLLAERGAFAGLGDWLAQDETLAVAGLSPELFAQLQKTLGAAPQPGQILLLDPLANWMMYYDPGSDPYGIVQDLKHLLRASQIG